MRAKSQGRYLRGMAGALLALAQTGALAAPPAPDEAGSTVVSPVVVSPYTPVPDIGPGATYFSLDDLTKDAHEAREDSIQSRDDAALCHGSDRGSFMKPHHTEQGGDFDLEALLDSAYKAQSSLSKRATEAAQATRAALDTRSALAGGEGSQEAVNATEIARQNAVILYQQAEAAVREANLRVADLEQLASDHVDGSVDDMQALEKGIYNPCGPKGKCFQDMRQFVTEVDERSYERAQNGGQQVIFLPQEYRDLKLSDIIARQYEDKGTPWLKISGTIENPRKSAIAVPPLWISLQDRYGTPLSTQQIEPKAFTKRIPAGGSVPFVYDYMPVPDKTARTSITFAPFHRSSGNLTASLFCDTIDPPDTGRPTPPVTFRPP